MKKCKNMDNEIILNEKNSGSVSSYQYVRVRCLFISCQGKKPPPSRFRTRMTRIARIFTDRCASASTVAPVDVARLLRQSIPCTRLPAHGHTWTRPQGAQPLTYGSRHTWRSVFHNTPSAFICVYLRLIFVSLSDRTQKAVSRDTNLKDDVFFTIQSKRSTLKT
jgi:hypothetical protein